MNEGMEPVFKQLIKSKKTKISNGLSIEINYLVFFKDVQLAFFLMDSRRT